MIHSKENSMKINRTKSN